MQLDSSSADNLRFDLRAYERLAELLPRLLAEDALEPLIAAIADAVEELIPCSAVLLFESREADGALMPILMRGLSRGTGRAPIHPDGDSLEALALASTEPVLSRRSTPSGGETIASVPLVVRGRATGCLTVHRGIDQVFLDEELRFLARLADMAAMSLDNVQARAKLAELAQTDELTGLLNRRGFFAAFDRILAQGARDGRCTSVLTVDVDDLKLVNDEFGHPAGDAVLVSVAETLTRRTRRGDVVGRLGGDEFAVVLSGATAGAAERVREELERQLAEGTVQTPHGWIGTAASVGAASAEPGRIEGATLVASSDRDMYLRKNAGTGSLTGASGEEGAGAGRVHR
ncbi:MAG: sensor domain-containing diguanylate cyclase [Actinobacteria bacterium]|nr:sensor domain-containing diguanylate cyclase [Actinomycetota bacterium]